MRSLREGKNHVEEKINSRIKQLSDNYLFCKIIMLLNSLVMLKNKSSKPRFAAKKV